MLPGTGPEMISGVGITGVLPCGELVHPASKTSANRMNVQHRKRPWDLFMSFHRLLLFPVIKKYLAMMTKNG